MPAPLPSDAMEPLSIAALHSGAAAELGGVELGAAVVDVGLVGLDELSEAVLELLALGLGEGWSGFEGVQATKTIPPSRRALAVVRRR
ncbi:hypothetical protein [Psychromicrobium sp. YIM B11713]|uniref:hypothetical protein n=1 Tax=Psychromicrobium sp. YIM B11713 TaxID=3145233 RepID=UPI00374FC3DA